MIDPFEMSTPSTLSATPNAISSPASECGATHSDVLAGLMIELYGPDHAPASHSVRPARKAASKTTGTCGRSSTASLPPTDLTLCLASRLRARTDSLGSTLFKLTWKERVTPSGRSICALRASGRRTSDSDCSSWPTPRAGTPAQKGYNEAGNTDSSRKTVALLPAPWRSPGVMSENATRGGGQDPRIRAAQGHQVNLCDQVLLLASGAPATGSLASTAKRGQLNPAHSRWLMGLPPEWDACAPTATRLSRRSRKHS
jgi:hypothetical protein